MKRSRGRRLVLAVIGWVLVQGAASAQDIPREVLAYADLILYNGKVITVDERFTVAQAIAVRDGKVLAVGDSARIVKMAGPATQKIDLAGRSVVPGFISPHDPNFVSLGRSADSIREVHLDGYLRELKKRVDAARPGEWVRARANRVPALLYGLNCQNLDFIAPNNPVLIDFDTSWSIVNSSALRHVDLDTPGVIKDKQGRPTCTVRGWANGVLTYDVVAWPDDLEPFYRTQKDLLERLRKIGVTTVGGRVSGLGVSVLRELWARGELPTRVAITHEFPMYNGAAEAYFKRMGNLMGVGDDWFRITGATVGPVDGISSFGGTLSVKPKIKELPTGSFGRFGENKWAWTQAGVDGYDPAGDTSWKDASEYTTMIVANRYGWNITDMHAQGDGGIDIILEALETANAQKPLAAKRFGNSHTIMRTPQQVQRMRKLGMTASVSPKYLFWSSPDDYREQYGADAVDGMTPVKSLIDAGFKVALEPNRGVDEAGGFNSYLAMLEYFVTRKNDQDGRVWGKHEAISREDALRAATIWSADFYFLETSRGSLEPGKLADLVVLGGDYLTVPEEQIGELPVAMVVVGGKIR